MSRRRYAQNPDQVSFSHKSDILYHDCKSMNFLQEKEPAPAPPTESFRNKKEYYKTVYAFSPRNPDELELHEGDQVTVSLH